MDRLYDAAVCRGYSTEIKCIGSEMGDSLIKGLYATCS